MASLPSTALRRTTLSSKTTTTKASTGYGHTTQQTRHASLLRRPIRPYTFTQLVQLSDGSTYTRRTTSPAPLYKSAKDTRNHPMWQPSLSSLRDVEEDEAGRLRAFRERFGRGWDAEQKVVDEDPEAQGGEAEMKVGEVKKEEEMKEESLMDLISGYGAQVQNLPKRGISKPSKKGKK